MKVLTMIPARPAQDGDGVKIQRVADFDTTRFDPFLMLDEIKSDDKSDFIGGFPPHPHRGIETFTYIRKGGFEHRDQMGNVKAIRGGDVQWMSTGRGVIHSEMPLADADTGLHGFQIWLNMPASEKMRPSRYQDTSQTPIPEVANSTGATLRVMAGEWQFADITTQAPIRGLAGEAGIADMMLNPDSSARLDVSRHEFAAVYIYQGTLNDQFQAGQMLLVDARQALEFKSGKAGAGVLVLVGKPIREQIVHMGPFVMNTQQEIKQAIEDYQKGRFGKID